MAQPVVLPKLEVPRQKLHWSFRMLWIAGGLLGVSMLVLGGAMYHVHSVRQEAEHAKEEIAAREKAEAEEKVQAALLAAAKAAEAKNLAEAKAAEAAAAKNLALANTVSTIGGSEAADDGSKGSGRRHHGHSKVSHKAGTKVALATKDNAPAAKSSSPKRNDAAIDELLSKMK